MRTADATAPRTVFPAICTFRRRLPSGYVPPVIRGSTAKKSLPAVTMIPKQQGTRPLGLRTWMRLSRMRTSSIAFPCARWRPAATVIAASPPDWKASIVFRAMRTSEIRVSVELPPMSTWIGGPPSMKADGEPCLTVLSVIRRPSTRSPTTFIIATWIASCDTSSVLRVIVVFTHELCVGHGLSQVRL